MSSRDPRFVALHRGGLLDRESHSILASWAADCAERVLPLYERTEKDSRPQKAILTGRAWAAGKLKTKIAMKASLAAHAAARATKNPVAAAAARSAGQAVATAHCADHSMGALLYVLKIHRLRGTSFEREIEGQIAKLPRKLRPMVRQGILSRLPRPVPGK